MIMSKYNSEKRFRCWTCKANGDDRFFDGRGKLQLHERTLHAERHQQQRENYKGTSKLYWSFRSRASIPEYPASLLGSKLRENVAMVPRSSMAKKIISYEELDNSEIEPEIDLKVPQISPSVSRNQSESFHEKDGEVRNFERESFNIRMRQILSEVDVKKSMIKKLREDLDKAELAIVESQGRESRLEDQLDIAKREVRKMRTELLRVPEIAENDKKQRNQLQKEFECEINSQKEQIIKLKEELEKERSATEEKEDKAKMVREVERKLRRLEKELEIEKRLKLEANRDRDECQKEVDELLIDNENFRGRLKLYQCELEKMQDEYKELMEEIHESASMNSETLEMRLVEAEASFERRLNIEREKLAKDIEDYRKQCEVLECKYQNSEQKLQNVMLELQEAKDELVSVESYRQGDINRLLEEKESLKVELKAKKGTLQILETSNDELASKVNDKDKQIRQLEKIKYLFESSEEKLQAFGVLESRFKETCQLLDEVEVKMKNLELESKEKIDNECQRRIEEKAELDKEIRNLESKLENMEEGKMWSQKELNELRTKNIDLMQRLEESRQEKQDLQSSLRENITLNKSFTETISEIDAKISSKEEEVSKLKELNRNLDHDMAQQKACSRKEIIEARESFQRYRAEVEGKMRNIADLEASFADERQRMKSKEAELMESVEILQEKLKEKDDKLFENEMERYKLVKRSERLEELQSNFQDLEQKLVVLEGSFELRKEECEGLRAKHQELLTVIQEKEKKLQQVEMELRDSEKRREKSEEEIQSLSDVRLELRRENNRLRNDLHEAGALNKEKDDELVLLRKKEERCDEMVQVIRQKDREISDKDKCIEEVRSELRRESNRLGKDLHAACALSDEKDGELVLLRKKVEKYDEMLQIIRKKDEEISDKNKCIEEIRLELKRENDRLRKDLHETCALKDEKESELVLLKKKVERCDEMLQIIGRKDDEINDKSKRIEKAEKEGCKLAAEVAKLEKIKQELKIYIELLEKDIKVVRDEKEVIENELNQNKEQLICLRNREKDMLETHVKANVDPLKKKILALEDNILLKEDSMRKAEQENGKLIEHIAALELELKDKDDMIHGYKEMDVRLAKKSKQLEVAKSKLQSLEQCLQDSENSCTNLKADLKFKREECEASVAKQSDFLRQIDEKERKCEQLERKLKIAEVRRCACEEGDGKAGQSALHGLSSMKMIVSDELQSARDELEQFKREKQIMQEDNEELKMKLEGARMTQQMSLNNGNVEALREMQANLEDTKERERMLQSSNYDLKKRLVEEEAQRGCLEEQICRLNSEVDDYKRRVGNGMMDDRMERAVGNWEHSFDGLDGSLADIEFNMPLNYSPRNRTDSKRGVDVGLKRSGLSLNEPEKGTTMLKKMDPKLAIELKESEEVIRGLERKVNVLESDLEKMGEDKRIIEEELRKNKELMKNFDCSEEDLVTACGKFKVLEEDNKVLEAKCEQLHKIIGKLEKKRRADRPDENLCDNSASDYKYNSLSKDEDVERRSKEESRGHNKNNDEDSLSFSEQDFVDLFDDPTPRNKNDVIEKSKNFFIHDDDDDNDEDFAADGVAVKDMAAFGCGYFEDSEVDLRSSKISQSYNKGGCFKSNSTHKDEEDILDKFLSKSKKQKSSKLPLLSKISSRVPSYLEGDQNFTVEHLNIEEDSKGIESGSMLECRTFGADDCEANRSRDIEADSMLASGEGFPLEGRDRYQHC